MDLFQSSHERRQREVGEVEAFIATNQERVVDMVEKEVRRLVYYLLIGPSNQMLSQIPNVQGICYLKIHKHGKGNYSRWWKSTIGIQNRKSSRFD